MRIRPSFLAFSLLLGFTALPLVGCDTGYWWSRGQPPSVETLLDRSQTKLANATKAPTNNNQKLTVGAAEIKKSLTGALNAAKDGPRHSPNVARHLKSARAAFLSLEGHLSPGSRPPYGELSGQLRSFITHAEKGKVDGSALGLFAARTFFFLSDELTLGG